MEKLFLAGMLFFLLVGSVAAGVIDVSGRAGMYNPGSGTSASMMYGVAANLDLTENVSLRGAVDTTSYNDGTGSVTYMPATLDLIYRQSIGGILTPYVGVGVGYNSLTRGGTTTATTGYQGEIGVRASLGGLTAGLEYRHIIPDAANGAATSSSNAYIQGGFSQSFII